jgi:hypothetical protein
MKRKQRKAKQQASNITVEQFNWGSLFKGSKEALISAGLAMPEHFKFKKGSAGKKYWLPFDWEKKYSEACYGPNFGPVPPRWDAHVSDSLNIIPGQYSVHVEYDIVSDLNVRQRVAQAMTVLRTAVELVESIAPVPVSEQLGFKSIKSE